VKRDAHPLTGGEPTLVSLPPILARGPVVIEMGVNIDQHEGINPVQVD
jgi:hypothetical protein